MCLVKFSFWKWACDSFGFGHESFSGFGAGASLVSLLAQHERLLEPVAEPSTVKIFAHFPTAL